MFKSIKRLAIVASLIAAAIIPSAAYARPILPDSSPYTITASTLPTLPAAPVHRVSATSADGFSWHDAGFGAAGMLMLVCVGAGATFAVRRRAVLS